MFDCFLSYSKDVSAVPLRLLTKEQFAKWIEEQTEFVKKWVLHNGFTAKHDTFCSIPGQDGGVAEVVAGIKGQDDCWAV